MSVSVTSASAVSAVQQKRDAQAYIKQQISLFPDQPHFTELRDSCDRQLWSQLGNKLRDLTRVPFFQSDQHLLKLYDRFVKPFETKLDPLVLSHFVIAASRQASDVAASIPPLTRFLATLQPAPSKKEKADKEKKAKEDAEKEKKSKEDKEKADKAAKSKQTEDKSGKEGKKDTKDAPAPMDIVKESKDEKTSTASGSAEKSKEESSKTASEAKAKANSGSKSSKSENEETKELSQLKAAHGPEAQASFLIRIEIARRKTMIQAFDDAKEGLDDVKTYMDAYVGMLETDIHSLYYLAMLEFYKAKAAAGAYFRHAMLYLTYTSLTTIPLPQQQQLAADVGLAALMGDDIYNFGELLQHPILRALDGSAWAWLPQLLLAFNAGNINQFKAIVQDVARTQTAVAKNLEFLSQKIRIMTLMELVFKRGTQNRTIPFTDIAKACDLPLDQVELMLMKAFSLHVIRGSIDEVSRTVRILWVQPRVLDVPQIAHIRDRLRGWAKEVHGTANFLQENAPQLF